MHRGLWQAAILLTVVAPTPIRAQAGSRRSSEQTDSVPNIGWHHLAVGGTVVLAAFLVDPPIAHYFDGPHSVAATNAARTLEKFGEITGIGAVVGGLGVASLITRDHHLLQATIRTAVGVALATGVTQVLKYTAGRQRPYLDPDRDGTDLHLFGGTPSGSPSFPSGHTSTAFALATSLGDAVHKTWLRVALFGIAAGTGWARLQQEQHWVTDVVAGAAVGIVTAKFADGRLRVLGMRAPRVLVSRHDVGLQWTLPLPTTH